MWTGSIQRDPRLHWGNIEANLRCPNLPHGNYNWWIAAEEAAENGYNGRRYTYINRIHFKCTNMVRWQQRISCYLIRPCRMKSTFTCFTYQVRRHVQWSIEQVGWHWPMSHCFDFLFIWEFFKRNFVALVSWSFGIWSAAEKFSLTNGREGTLSPTPIAWFMVTWSRVCKLLSAE